MDDKITLKAKNREELDKMIKRTLTLEEGESFEVTVLKEPKKILFFNIDGEYLVEIIKKKEEEVKPRITVNKIENRKFESRNFGQRDKKKFDQKEKKYLKENEKNGKRQSSSQSQGNVFKEKNQNIENYSREAVQIKKEEGGKPLQGTLNDANISRIRGFIKEFIVNSKLDLKIVNISKEGERYVVNVDGKDIRYLIGEKGSSLNAVEYLLSSVKTLKNLKVVIDSNNYKKKREEALRDLARKKGKKVLDSGRSIKLNPMPARERKIIHEEVSFIKGLKTESVGEEPKRYLVIKKI